MREAYFFGSSTDADAGETKTDFTINFPDGLFDVEKGERLRISLAYFNWVNRPNNLRFKTSFVNTNIDYNPTTQVTDVTNLFAIIPRASLGATAVAPFEPYIPNSQETWSLELNQTRPQLGSIQFIIENPDGSKPVFAQGENYEFVFKLQAYKDPDDMSIILKQILEMQKLLLLKISD